MTKALINGGMLRWARERAALPPEELAAKLHQDVGKLLAWEAGDEHPTFKQAQKLASASRIPFGYLFLPEPPHEEIPLPDLRTVGSEPAESLDANFKDLLNDVLFKHDWFVDVLEEQGVPKRRFVGRFTLTDEPAKIAEHMRETLDSQVGDAQRALNWEDHLRGLMQRAESAGIWVMRSGIVGSNTQRPLSVRQFRGFAISHPLAPLIFINGRDAKAAQIFTLAHELAHIWLGESGISNVFLGKKDYGNRKKVEVACNRIAAEFLVPSDAFKEAWNDNLSAGGNYDRLARQFKVSQVVIARRALDLGKIAERAYAAFYREEEESWEEDKGEGGSGGNFYATLPIRNGQRFTNTVVARAISGQTLLRDAAALLNAKPASVQNYYKKAVAG